MKSTLLSVLMFSMFLSFPILTQARSGCCSWHGGVSGCDSSVGRQVCNDGTLSPSCTCAKAAPTPAPKPVVTPIQKQVAQDPPMIKDILAEKTAYTLNHDGFRENLISELSKRYPDQAAFNQIAMQVYRLLPDIKPFEKEK